jgi:predicted transcriptional regulator
MLHERKDHLTAQKVEVALVFQQMLSTEEAHSYLAGSGVAESVIQRVLYQPALRRGYDASARGAFVNHAA